MDAYVLTIVAALVGCLVGVVTVSLCKVGAFPLPENGVHQDNATLNQ